MSRKMYVLFGSAALLSAAVLALAQDKKDDGKTPPAAQKPAQPSKLPACPVMNEPIDITVKTMTDDGPVYFCCEMCIDKFKKDEKKFADKVTAQRAALAKLERVQVSCPISGKPVDGKTTASVDGQTISFCCPKCPAVFQAKPASFKAKLEASFSYQTKCPVSGEKIDPTTFTDLPTGQRIFTCCKDCGPKLTKDLAKYAPKLEAMGIALDMDKLGGGKKKDAPKADGDDDHNKKP